MVRSAREKIALLLEGGESAGSFSVETSAPAAGVTLSVDGVGPVKLPVGAPQERALVSVARPAMFGLGEETLTDTSVRDTWELTAEQVRLGGTWDRVLDDALVEVHEGLGLPRGSRLRAYTLRLVKQSGLHDREAAQRRQAAADLAWLRGE